MYHAVVSDCLFNVAVEDSHGLEQVANTLLIPCQYVLAGRTATLHSDGQWQLSPRFLPNEYFWLYMTGSAVAFPASLLIGGTLKSLSLLSQQTRQNYRAICQRYRHESIVSLAPYYQSLGIPMHSPAHFFTSLSLPRRPGDDRHLQQEKECLAEIAALLNAAHIAWWLDCGSCLGAYRYGGVIPWDEDIDIAVLLPEFENILCALSHLDPKKYLVQDWSGRDHPKSYIKVFLRSTGGCLDIYHFAIEPNKKQLCYLLSLIDHVFLPEWWKVRESRFTVPTPFAEVFPLQKALFDGVEVFLPANPEKYLQRRYGENLAPVKIYNPQTNCYEKDLTHPYWMRSFVH